MSNGSPTRIDVITLFPDMFQNVLGSSILKRAAEPVTNPADPSDIRQPVVSYHVTNLRDYADNKHSKVDQPSFGGGPGMVIQCQPVWDAVHAVQAMDDRPATRILLTPQGTPLTQPIVEELAQQPRLLMIAGHYEGIDERVIQKLAPIQEISIGDYVLSGGELPAMVLIDAIVRLIPGALGHQDSAHHDSFSPGSHRLLDHPHYTRPRTWQDMEAPEILLSGDHAKIEAWRKQQALERTRERRPDLLK
jgi:tRNA (guanine37-N1)-methyltransferase